MFFVVLLSTSSQMWRQSVHKCGDSLYTNVETVCTQMWRQSVHKCGDSLYTNQATTASCYILSNSLFAYQLISRCYSEFPKASLTLR